MIIKSFVFLLSAIVHSLVGTSPACRHTPTCSHYAVEAMARRGWFTGVFLAAKRLWRCRPGGSYGWDPVPLDRKRV